MSDPCVGLSDRTVFSLVLCCVLFPCVKRVNLLG